MDVPDSLLQHAQIKILVVPVGNIPEDKFNFYFDIINKFKVIMLQDLTPDYSGGHSKSSY